MTKVMHRVCTGYAQVMHRVCTGYAQGVHKVCTGCAQGMHRLCTGCAQGVHRVFNQQMHTRFSTLFLFQHTLYSSQVSLLSKRNCPGNVICFAFFPCVQRKAYSVSVYDQFLSDSLLCIISCQVPAYLCIQFFQTVFHGLPVRTVSRVSKTQEHQMVC